jgi:hypothetical protein
MADLGPLGTTASVDIKGDPVRVVPDSIATMLASGMKFYQKRSTHPGKVMMVMVKKHEIRGAGGRAFFKEYGALADQVKHGIYGTVTYEDLPGAGLLLRLYDRTTGELLSETTSDGSGNYDFNYWVPEGHKYYVVAFDSNLVPIYNAKIRDYLDPKLIP